MFAGFLAWMERMEALALQRNREAKEHAAVLVYQQRRIIRLLEQLVQKETVMSKEMDDLVAEVAKANAGVDSAVVAIAGLRQQIIDAGTDPAKLAELTTSLKGAEDRLANAIVAPAPPPPAQPV